MKNLFFKEIKLVHTNSDHPDFKELSSMLEGELFERDGNLAEVNYELNKIDFLPDVVVAYCDDMPVACGAFRLLDQDSVEIKRMYVHTDYRRNKLAETVLSELESLSKKMGYKYCLLETGKNQPEAIALYLKNKYVQISNFGKYIGSINSICFRKQL